MPKMNGVGLVKKMTGIYPELKVLFMSGYTENVIVHLGVLDEGVNFIHKPISPVSLAQAVSFL
jgi:YesN/AraC family two-component response regulator